MGTEITMSSIKDFLSMLGERIKGSKQERTQVIMDIDIHEKTVFVFTRNILDRLISMFSVPFEYDSLAHDFSEKIEEIIDNHIITKFDLKDVAIYVILPNEGVSLDEMTVPIVNKKQMKDALDTMVSSNYKNHNDLLFKSTVLFTNKEKYVYRVLSVRRSIINCLMAGLSSHKTYPKTITFKADALTASIIRLMPRQKGKSFVFLDIKNKTADASFVNKGITTGYYTFGFGTNLFDARGVVPEKILMNHPLAESSKQHAYKKAGNMKAYFLGEEEKKEEEVPEYDLSAIIASYDGKFKAKDLTENYMVLIKWINVLIDSFLEKNPELRFDSLIINVDGNHKKLFTLLEEDNPHGLTVTDLRSVTDAKEVILNNMNLYGALYVLEQGRNITD